MKFTPPLAARFPDVAIDGLRRNVDQRIGELQALPLVDAVVIPDVILPSGVVTAIPHKLGRVPRGHALSAVRSVAAPASGVIREHRDTFPGTGAAIDRARILVLVATNYGTTVTVDVTVW